MKYEGQRPSGQDKDVPVYMFSVGKDELEILTKLVQVSYENTPRLFDIMPYRNRLRNLVKVFGKTYTEVVKGKTLPTKRTHKFHDSLKKNMS